MVEFIKQYWLQCAMAVLSTGFGVAVKTLYTRLKREIKEQALIKAGMLAILHDRLYQACRYHIQQGFCTVSELKNTEYLYKSYHILGGNGTGTELFERVKRLPIDEKGEVLAK